jgi:NAD(P)H-dependent FMN reductase
MTEQDRTRLAIIIGSTRQGRFGPVPAAWFAAQAGGFGRFEVEVIDLAETGLPAQLNDFTDPVPQPVLALGERLMRADAFVVVTPEYNHSVPASLKHALDWYMEEWKGKPVGFLSYGGAAGGVRAVEHLRQIFAEFHTVTVRDALLFSEFWNKFDEDGRPRDAEGAAKAAKAMLEQLDWWSTGLRRQRGERPYVA